MQRKGLSQILYLIIAASVLMMVAMVVTFTATDVIGNLGGTAESTACGDSLKAQCTATSSQAVNVPSSCITQDQWVESYLQSRVYPTPQRSASSTINPEDYEGDGYVACTVVPN
ncbi:hypothetical protein GLU64_00700 [Nanohaloarchaea archaeon]|nr:hypothetical protein [Candidatus Nanohaloarchaea archaeon]